MAEDQRVELATALAETRTPLQSLARRRLLEQMAAGVVGGLSGALQQALAAEPARAQGVRSVRGTVLVNGAPAVVGTPVPADATVVTQAGAEVTYVVGRDAFLQRAGTRVEIGRGASIFRVVTGALLGVFTPKSRRTVSTSVITAGIRGTGCYVEAEARRTYFCLCYGAVDLTPINGSTRSYTTKRHDSPFWVDQSGNLTPGGMRNHDDAELALLESLVGRQVPFQMPYKR